MIFDMLLHDISALLRKRDDLQTILDRATLTSVKINGLYVPVGGLGSRLSQFAQSLAIFSDMPGYEVYLRGSATGLAYGGKYFLCCTDHQLNGVKREDVGLMLHEQKVYLSSGGFIGYLGEKVGLDSDAEDLCVFDFSEPLKAHPTLVCRFFPVQNHGVLGDGDEAVAYLVSGYPSADQKYDVDNGAGHIGTVKRPITCEPAEQGADPAVGSCKTVAPMDFNPDGLSGGPVFALAIEGATPIVIFAGIVNRAGNGYIHFIKAGNLVRMFEYALA